MDFTHKASLGLLIVLACLFYPGCAFFLPGSLGFFVFPHLSGNLFQGFCLSGELPLLFFARVMMYALVRVEGKFLEFFGGLKEGHFLSGWLNLVGEACPLSS